jgi:hypothetical protein
MHPPLPDAVLRATWRRMRMLGDFENAMRNPILRQTVEAAARAWQYRDAQRAEQAIDFKRRAAGDQDD